MLEKQQNRTNNLIVRLCSSLTLSHLFPLYRRNVRACVCASCGHWTSWTK